MVSRDLIQAVKGPLSEPEVRVWHHPRSGVVRDDEHPDDQCIVYEGGPLNQRLDTALDDIMNDEVSEPRLVIAYDGYEFYPYEFFQYADDYEFDRMLLNIEQMKAERPPRPDTPAADDPLMARLTPGVFFEIHDGEKQTILDLLITHDGELETLYTAIKTHDDSAPSQTQLAAEGLEFHDLTQ